MLSQVIIWSDVKEQHMPMYACNALFSTYTSLHGLASEIRRRNLKRSLKMFRYQISEVFLEINELLYSKLQRVHEICSDSLRQRTRVYEKDI